MTSGSPVESKRVRWRGRRAWTLSNGRIAACWLTGGGHLASLVYRADEGESGNLIWEAPWKTIEPESYSPGAHARKYGPPPAGKYLAGYTGHAVCLDYFGEPSQEEASRGLPLHGEIASRKWSAASGKPARGEASLVMRATAPTAGLRFERQVSLRTGESAISVKETVTNAGRRDRFFQWVQHASFGPPLLQTGESVCVLNGERGKTWPHGYEGRPALANDREFNWPMAPAANGQSVNISQPFAQQGLGFIATVLLRRDAKFGFVGVLNWRMGILAAYCFRTADFPWVAVWEENGSRAGQPWNGVAQVRGLEFGTSPMPIGIRHALLQGPLFGVPVARSIAAGASQSATYDVFATSVPKTWRAVGNVEFAGGKICVTGGASFEPGRATERIELPAKNVEDIALD
ncbi:MAG: DUF4432 family protein [Candidatus Acidiferrales bacterium]